MNHIDKIVEQFFTDANKFLPSGIAVKLITPEVFRALLQEATEEYRKDAEVWREALWRACGDRKETVDEYLELAKQAIAAIVAEGK